MLAKPNNAKKKVLALSVRAYSEEAQRDNRLFHGRNVFLNS